MTSYGQGYADGKTKAHAEVRRWRPDRHAHGCQCDVCLTALAVLRAFSDYADAALAVEHQAAEVKNSCGDALARRRPAVLRSPLHGTASRR